MPEALASLSGTGGRPRVLVLDADSRDRTRLIAAEAGARVLQRRWSDFVDARRFALAHVETPWAFMLDADERLDEDLRAALEAADPERDGCAAYAVHRDTLFCGKTLHAFGWDDERLIRVFRPANARLEARPAAGGSASLHERWIVDGRVGELSGKLMHDSYPDRATYRRKFARYTSLEAEGLEPSFLRLGVAVALTIPRWLRLVFLRGGARAGSRGLYVAWWSALYPAVAQWKALARGKSGRGR
ncbi:MAG: glycosyltransferase family 2 protein [Candidatus Eremiobacteraeota bacterium]|nr:glycosyltransferase family 2 protein [Candidatus Eremiobacteraeota bacterium]